MATLLQIVQKFCQRTGLKKPSSVAGSLDTQTLQYLELANEVVSIIADECYWNELVREATFTTVATENQGAMSTLAPYGFLGIVKGTIFDRTQQLEVHGPLTSQEWAEEKALVPVGPLYQYRIRGGNFLMLPVPAAGHTVAFEYFSDAAIYNPVDAEYKSEFTKDTDTFLLDTKVLILGLRAMWKKEKGLAYAEEYDNFVRSLTNSAARNGTKKTLHMDDSSEKPIGPGIVIQPGSWNL